jgi:HD-GYP domain-containing protein (c-di-GMP phosphodiesterase class II)
MPTQSAEKVDASLLSIAIDKFVEGACSPCDVFVQENGKAIALFNKGMIFDASTICLLRKKGITEVLIKPHELETVVGKKPANAAPETQPAQPMEIKEYIEKKEDHFQIERKLLIPDEDEPHFQVDKALLMPETEIYFNIYVLNPFGFRLVVEASEKAPAKLRKTMFSIAGDLVIKKTDMPKYQAYLNSLLASKVLPPREHSRMQSIVIKENSKLLIKDLLENPRSGEKIKESVIVVNKMVDNILDNRDAIYELISIRSHDYYTYTHSVNVAALSVGLGIAAGLDRSSLEKLGIGTMLHDIGKSMIPHEILNKPGRLTDDEFTIMKTHVTESEKLLRLQKDIPEESYPAVVQHHEKLSGTGYPLGISGADIKMFGKIAAIADCYDAMTTQRSYKPAFTPFHALSIIVNETGHYDRDLLNVFIKMLGKLA